MLSTLQSYSPRTGAPLHRYGAATPDLAATAAAAAGRAHRRAALAVLDSRAQLLRTCAAVLRARSDRIVAVADAETALGTQRLTAELARTAGQLEAFAGVVASGDVTEAIIELPSPGATPPSPDLRRMLVPLGPVVVFGAGNFPLAFGAAGGDVASAFAAGCPVIVKGHPSHPGTGELVAAAVSEAVDACDLDAAVYSHLLAADLAVGEALIDADEVRAVAFTGSSGGGSAIALRAASRRVPIPVYAEMGSLNPLVVLAGALEARADDLLEGLATSLSGNAGQLCTKPGLVLVPASDAGKRFRSRLEQRLAASGSQPMLDERLRAGHRAALNALAGSSAVECPGTDAYASCDGGYRQPFTVLSASAAAVAEEALLREEIFGPAVVIATYSDPDELLGALDALEGQLTGTIHAEVGDELLARRVAATLLDRAGRLIFNGYPTGVPVTHATVHGGPWPATNAPTHTSVGLTAARRFLRPVAFQNAPPEWLPAELRDDNPLELLRREAG